MQRDKVIKEVIKFVNNLHLSDCEYPIGETAVPPTDPEWDYEGSPQKWEKDHFLLCIKAGPQADYQKTMNYSKVSAVSQGPDENPTTFLERLRESLIKHTNLDLESYEGQAILKFLTLSASDTRRNLQKLIQESGVLLDEMLTTTNAVFYKWGQQKEAMTQEKEKMKETKHDQFLAMPNF